MAVNWTAFAATPGAVTACELQPQRRESAESPLDLSPEPAQRRLDSAIVISPSVPAFVTPWTHGSSSSGGSVCSFDAEPSGSDVDAGARGRSDGTASRGERRRSLSPATRHYARRRSSIQPDDCVPTLVALRSGLRRRVPRRRQMILLVFVLFALVSAFRWALGPFWLALAAEAAWEALPTG